MPPGRRQPGENTFGLTPREVEVWHLLATGSDNKEIARAMEISVSTVKNYITSIFEKLDVRDRAQAVIAAYESGLAGSPRATGPG
ncbi:response regulator transcription factor [Streptomyces griseus]|uniref:response regulator transcription factor n=1 Tax=Streptomyces griseus TaxID=1911 RepID=UPI003F69B246